VRHEYPRWWNGRALGRNGESTGGGGRRVPPFEELDEEYREGKEDAKGIEDEAW